MPHDLDDHPTTDNGYLPEPYVPQEVNDLQMAFGGDVRYLMPDTVGYERNANPEWERIGSNIFFKGVTEEAKFHPAEDIDPEQAFRHIMVVLRSWSFKHEHKEWAVGLLFKTWFTYIDLGNGVTAGTKPEED